MMPNPQMHIRLTESNDLPSLLQFDDSYTCNSNITTVKGVPVITFTGETTNARGHKMEVTYYWAYDAGHSYPVAAIMKGSFRIFHWWKKNFTGLVTDTVLFSLPFHN